MFIIYVVCLQLFVVGGGGFFSEVTIDLQSIMLLFYQVSMQIAPTSTIADS